MCLSTNLSDVPHCFRPELRTCDYSWKDELNHVVTFHVGVTAWSWGYNMILKVTPGANETSDVAVEVARSGGKTVS